METVRKYVIYFGTSKLAKSTNCIFTIKRLNHNCSSVSKSSEQLLHNYLRKCANKNLTKLHCTVFSLLQFLKLSPVRRVSMLLNRMTLLVPLTWLIIWCKILLCETALAEYKQKIRIHPIDPFIVIAFVRRP